MAGVYHLQKAPKLWHFEPVCQVLDKRFPGGISCFVELGTYLGHFSEAMLNRYPKARAIVVDPFPMDTSVWENSLAKSKLDYDPENMRLIKEAAIKRLSVFGDRVTWHFLCAHEAALLVPHGSFDICFMDHEHTYEAMTRDLPLWWELTGQGKVLSGHDYKENRSPRHRWKVNQAVDEFAAKLGKPVVPGDGKTWFIFKD